MEKSKKFRMPAGIRNKLMAAIAMLLVSSIMMVSSTYAWFTLSTAPEVTGITTSVGANGNLEIALLTTDTYANMDQIASAVGNSSAVQAVNLANITWGNLVDLSDASYGLTGIALMPAALNYATITEGGVTTPNQTKIMVANPLMTAQYGADGRVSTVDGQTVSAVAANGAFAYDASANQTYGVRAIGVVSNLSARDIALKNAKNVVNSTINSAKTATKSAIYSNMVVMLNYALAAKDGATPTSYSQDDLNAFVAIANGVISDLAALENGYKNAAIAYAAANATDDEAFALAKATIDTTPLSGLASLQGMNALSGNITALVAAQGSANDAKTTLASAAAIAGGITQEANADVFANVNAAIKKLVDGIDADASALPVNAYIEGGAVGELGAQVGTFTVATMASMGAVYAGAKDSDTVKFNAVVNAMPDLSVTNGASGVSNITDTYGYAIDFAFRTNAADSSLQLQTSAVNRVYSDAEGTDLATQGAGSTVTYAYHPDMTVEQVNKMLGAIRIVFVDTASGEIYKTAKLTNIAVNDTEATAKVTLDGQAGDVGTITALNQNEAKAISVLVYLDGYAVDNTAVPNAANSGMLNLNLQFSSSATLIPMQNTALEQMTAYTVSFNANGGIGFMPAAKASSGTYTLPATSNFVAPDGKQFAGWSTTANDANTKVTTVTEATTVYAIWEDIPAQQPATEYTVTYVAGEGTTGTAPSDGNSYAANATVTVLGQNGLAKDGHTFGGWNDGTTTYAEGQTFTITGNTTLNAVWNAN